MGFDRMRIPLIRSLSGSIIGSDKRRPKSRSRSRPPAAETSSVNNSAITLDDDSIPPVPRIPSEHVPEVTMHRKIWVKRSGASATRVEVDEEDLVDNVRDVILTKYANSLGRSIDSPDITLKIVTRDASTKGSSSERVLGPEEPISRILDDHFPGGQTIEEALVIDIPQRRTPRPSPRPGNHQVQYFVPQHYRPDDAAPDYFGPMPVQSPHVAHVQHNPSYPSSMAVLTTGQLPALPSPGGHTSRRHGRPKYARQHTSSPTILHTSQPNGIIGKEFKS